MQRDQLFIIGAPFEDMGQKWFCRDCAMIEGALAVNPAWRELVDVHRVAFPRPREQVIALLGVDNQSLPALVLADASAAPEGAKRYGERAFLTDVRVILEHLHAMYGGVGPHL